MAGQAWFSLLIKPPASVNPARWKNRPIADSCTKAVRVMAKYGPIGAMSSKQEVMERHSLLSLEYRVHHLASLGIPILGELGGVPDVPGDM